ncbi:unnamed protein product, partial [Mesorhabditis spiculigera]
MLSYSLAGSLLIFAAFFRPSDGQSIDAIFNQLSDRFRKSARVDSAEDSDSRRKMLKWSQLMRMGGDIAKNPKYALLHALTATEPPVEEDKSEFVSQDNLKTIRMLQSMMGFVSPTTPRSGVSFQRIFERTMGASPWSRMAGTLLDTVSTGNTVAERERPTESLFRKTWYGEALGTVLGIGDEEKPIYRAAPPRNFGITNFLNPYPAYPGDAAASYMARRTTEAPPVVNPLELFSRPLQNFIGTQNRDQRVLETGNDAFDRLVVHENEGGGLLSNRWNKRGLQWTDGNLKLVNMKGSDLLGSEVAVHDRSIDIPVQSWIDLASGLVSSAQGHERQQDDEFRA